MKQPWIYSAPMDGAFILAPALIITAAILFFQESIASVDAVPPWAWGVLIVGVDVAHVYSTLFRTYADAHEFQARRTLYVLTPLLCWAIGTLLYSIDAIVFWRAIAYLAVFHFVRQQYGLMMIYGRKERLHVFFKLADKIAIYMATLYPLIYWHTHMPRNFDWFIEGDFFSIQSPWLHYVALIFYVIVLLVYIVKEAWIVLTTHSFNVPKNTLLAGTALSWWVGIVFLNNDLAFTAANVLAHGIPYMALIWIYGRNQGDGEPKKIMIGKLTFRRLFTFRWLPWFVGILILFAYMEEGLWDGLVWTEHKSFFSPFQVLPTIDSSATLAWLIPLLALPQLTHYALDGFIWRLGTQNTPWKRILFYRQEH